MPVAAIWVGAAEVIRVDVAREEDVADEDKIWIPVPGINRDKEIDTDNKTLIHNP